MESIGAKLREAREAKDLSIEQAARDTHIAKRFLEALEAEAYEEFPGQVYLIGFLRTYGDYLELKGEELVTMYRNLQIQEQPPPMEELLERPAKGPSRSILVGGSLIIIALVLIGLFMFGVIRLPERPEPVPESTQQEPIDPQGSISVLDQEFLERRFESQDGVEINGQDGPLQLRFVKIEGDQLSLSTPSGVAQIAVGENRPLDLDGDGSMDVRILVRETSADAQPATAVVRIDRVVQSPNVSRRELSAEESEELALGQTTEPTRRRQSLVVTEAAAPREFFIEAEFRGQCLFRYEFDSKQRQQAYFRPGDRIRDSVEREARIWASNAGAVELRVAGEPIGIGADGEVKVVLIRWRENDNGRYQLVMLPLY